MWSAIVFLAPIPPAFFGSSHDFVAFEPQTSAHHIRRGWSPFDDIRLYLLIYVNKGETMFARITSRH